MKTAKHQNSNKSLSALRLKVIKTIDENALLENVSSVLLGFSGGVDSSVLFDVLLSLRERYGFTLYALHVNHLIRGDESDSDEEFVKSVCEANGVELTVVRADIPKICKETGKSLELAARDARYEAFAKIAEEKGIDVIATAHNADDNAETVLYNLIRGTHLKGMCGIPYKRGNIIRPLRDVTRKEIDSYASLFSVSHVFDSTNAVPDCTRNKIRLEVIPLIKGLNPSFAETLIATSKNFLSLADFVSSVSENEDDDLSGGHPALIASKVISLCGYTEREMLDKVVKAVKEKKNVTFDMQKGKILSVSNGRIKVTENKDDENYAFVEYLLLKDGENIFDDTTKIFLNVSKNSYDFNKFSTTVAFTSATINDELYARSRKPGDEIKINGITKSVKKEFINKKIPRKYRDSVPVICSGSDIVAVPFIGVSDAYKTKDKMRDSFTVCFAFDISDN